MLRDALSLLFKQKALAAQVASGTTDLVGAGIDLQGNRSMAFMVLVGVSGDTLSGSLKLELFLEDSDDNVTFAPCANADVDGAIAGVQLGTFAIIDDAAEDDALYVTQYLGFKRYVRVSVNLVGTHTNGTPIAAIACEPNPEVKPQG